MFKIYHNPRCSKSRQTLELLKSKVDDSNIEIIEYLTTVPKPEELLNLFKLLKLSADKVLRKNEADFKQFKGQDKTDNEWAKIMQQFPKLIERPIVVKDNKAIIGRPPENVLQLF